VTVAEIVGDVRNALLMLGRRFPAPLVAIGHSAGGHLASAAVATDWAALGMPKNLVRHGLAISGVFDLQPLTKTSMNLDLRLDEETATAMSPAFWRVPTGVVFEAWVGATESSEFLRQSRLVAERWSKAGAKMRFLSIPDANHFTAPMPLADPESAMVRAVATLAERAKA
jgi:arylformamidase